MADTHLQFEFNSLEKTISEIDILKDAIIKDYKEINQILTSINSSNDIIIGNHLETIKLQDRQIMRLKYDKAKLSVFRIVFLLFILVLLLII
jgi:hypothetical protein